MKNRKDIIVKQIIFFICILVPAISHACEWKVQVTDLKTNEQ